MRSSPQPFRRLRPARSASTSFRRRTKSTAGKAGTSFQLDTIIDGIIGFWVRYVRTIAHVAISPIELAKTSCANDANRRYVAPYLFLLVASAPGSIYFASYAKAQYDKTGSYRDVSMRIADAVDKFDFTITSLFLSTLPILLITAVAGVLLDRSFRKRQQCEKNVWLNMACYAIGFAMFAFVSGALLPLALRAIIPDAIQLSPGLVLSNISLPLAAALSGLPFIALGIFVAGRLVFVSATLNSPPRFGAARIWINGIGVVVLAFASISALSQLYATISLRNIIGAKVQKIGPNHRNVFCRGGAIEVNTSGHVTWNFIVKNDSDQAIYLRDTEPKFFLGFDRSVRITNAKIAGWAANNVAVLHIPPNAESWATIVGEITPEAVKHIQTEGNKVGGKSPRLAWVSFKAVGSSDVVCNAQDQHFKDERPVMLATKL